MASFTWETQRIAKTLQPTLREASYTLALSRGERELERFDRLPRPLGEGLGVRAYNFCQSMRQVGLADLPAKDQIAAYTGLVEQPEGSVPVGDDRGQGPPRWCECSGGPMGAHQDSIPIVFRADMAVEPGDILNRALVGQQGNWGHCSWRC